MSEQTDRLDQLIDQLLRGDVAAATDDELLGAFDVARDLIDLPREQFRADLGRRLERTTHMTTTEYIPTGLTALTPYLLVRDTVAAIDFYTEVFGASEVMRHEAGGQVVHAKIRIGEAMVELGLHGDRTSADVEDRPPVGMHLYVDDVDAVFAKANAAGARTLQPVEDQPYGDREVSLADPFGVVWFVATHLHD